MMTNTTVRFNSAAVSDKGLSEKRPVNEDSYLEMTERGLFAVADGVGGAQAGDVASQMAMEVLYEAFSHPQPNIDTEELMEMAIQRANQSIHQMSRELPQLDMMATTIVTLHLSDTVATIGHVGDSRLYRLDTRGNLFRETQDHSVVEEEVRAGRMTLAQAANHPSRNVISRALGAEDTVEVDMKTIMYEPGTVFLLCSDGVTRHLEDHEIRDILLNLYSPSDICGEIKEICYSRGAEDNLTAVVIRVETGGETALSDDDDEITVAGVRPTFQTADGNGVGNSYSSAEAPTERLPELNAADAETAPLSQPQIAPGFADDLEHETIADAQPVAEAAPPIAEPVAQTVEPAAPIVEAAATAPDQATLQSKIDNERLRAKVNAAETLPAFENIQPYQKESVVGKLLTWLLILLVGAAIGAGALYLWMQNQKQPAAPAQPVQQQTAPTSQNTPALQNPLQDFSQAELNEYKTFERVRRTTDEKPSVAVAASAAAPKTAADFYLRGRAFLQIGRYEDALMALKSAEEELPNSPKEVNAETLRVDIALAQAALAAMANNPNQEKMLGELVNEKKAAAVSTNANAPANPSR